MTAAYKAAKAWYDAKPSDRSFHSDFDREEFTRGMVQSLAGHLEPFFKSEVDRMAGPLIQALRVADISLDESESESFRFNARVLISTILDNYRKEMSK